MMNKSFQGDYRSSACATLITFFFFALFAGMKGYHYQHGVDWIDEHQPSSDAVDQWKDQMFLFYTVAACVAASTILYVIFLAAELYTGLFLRVIVLTCSMIIYVGATANGASEEGLQEEVDVNDFNTMEWAQIGFAVAWVFIASFEINQICSKENGRFIAKIQFCCFYTILSLSIITMGFLLMDKEKSDGTDGHYEDKAYDPNIHGKIVLAAGIVAALAAVAFMFYMCLDHPEPIKIHMICVAVFILTLFGAVGYKHKQRLADISDWEESASQKKVELKDFFLEMEYIAIASNVFQVLSIATILGFNVYFFETAPQVSQNPRRRPRQHQPRGLASV